jgi:hypothetical protein
LLILRGEAVDRPCIVFAGEIDKPVVQAVTAALPEFDFPGYQAVTAPMTGSWDFFFSMGLLKIVKSFFQFLP